MLVTGISGGTLDQLFSVFEFDAVDDLGEAFGTVEAAPLPYHRHKKGWPLNLYF